MVGQNACTIRTADLRSLAWLWHHAIFLGGVGYDAGGYGLFIFVRFGYGFVTGE